MIAEAAHQVAFGDRHPVTTTMAAEAASTLARLRGDHPAFRVGVHTQLRDACLTFPERCVDGITAASNSAR
ncbi:hypothetical protein [Streptomyces swartbergensis]|uniref:hypothetical protein n=1 Tax=Streptomyces swartbergensis TaxID=487165 RepID=UPI00381871C7